MGNGEVKPFKSGDFEELLPDVLNVVSTAKETENIRTILKILLKKCDDSNECKEFLDMLIELCVVYDVYNLTFAFGKGDFWYVIEKFLAKNIGYKTPTWCIAQKMITGDELFYVAYRSIGCKCYTLDMFKDALKCVDITEEHSIKYALQSDGDVCDLVYKKFGESKTFIKNLKNKIGKHGNICACEWIIKNKLLTLDEMLYEGINKKNRNVTYVSLKLGCNIDQKFYDSFNDQPEKMYTLDATIRELLRENIKLNTDIKLPENPCPYAGNCWAGAFGDEKHAAYIENTFTKMIININTTRKNTDKKIYPCMERPICLETFVERQVIVFSCGHYFHTTCIDEYKNVKGDNIVCPLCRNDEAT